MVSASARRERLFGPPAGRNVLSVTALAANESPNQVSPVLPYMPLARRPLRLPLRLEKRRLAAIPLSIAYSLFVVLFPWESITRVPFSDWYDSVLEINYLHNFNNIPAAEVYQVSTVREYLLNEILWHELVRGLTNLTGEAVVSLRILSLFILFVWALFLLKRVPYGVALLFLFNPTAIDVALSGIRNGLAWSLFIIGLSSRSRILRAALFGVGMFIHSATVALVVIYYLTRLASRIARPRLLLVSGLVLGASISLALTIGNTLVLGALGDRRVGADYVVGGGSLLQLSIWGILLFLQCKSDRAYVRRNIFVISVLAWYVTMNSFIPWSFRIWGSLMPVIAVAAMDLPPQTRKAFLYAYSGYLALQYIYWTKLLDYWVPS